ncbi:MFS general substrate transporter-7 [Coleophoma cylindrospora]|uniref:MFS general substrate transporter-7 n=1 Tax=Coleophoma cylindrospora TaxID=1849047 RepID=A0A3D8S808_9HELO|nr:MFS general substrate transporter-7 [Coleophoma cylindrospora]
MAFPDTDSSASTHSSETQGPHESTIDVTGEKHVRDQGLSDVPFQGNADEKDIEHEAATTNLQATRSRTSIFSRKSRIVQQLARDPIPETDLSNNIVGWEGQEDPAMPMNFPDNRKLLLLCLVSTMTFVAPLASSMFAPGVSFMAAEFHSTSTMLDAFTISIFVLGFAIGPLLLSPLSEIYGRKVVLDCANGFFVVWQIGCALAPNISALLIFRFLAGLGGSGCITLGSGVIADLYTAEARGKASAIFSLGPLFGPVVGPICGGFISQRAGWRWAFWVVLIASAPTAIGIGFLNRETNHRVLIERKTLALRKELNRPELRSCYVLPDAPVLTPTQMMSQAIVRPFILLFRSPIVFILALYMAFIYGLLYLLFTTITSVFQETYHWSVEICGLAYLGVGIGFFIGTAVVGKTSDKSVIAQTKKNNGIHVPEFRLPGMIFFAFFVPISFFWYGWSADKGVHFIVPIIGMVPFGFGMIGLFINIQTYVIDIFPVYAASASASLNFMRSLFGAVLPLAGPSLYASLGLGWGNSLLGFIAIAMIPAPMLLWKYGGRVRERYPVKL